MMKRRTAAVIAEVLLLVMLIPVPVYYKDGGTKENKAILYSVTKKHAAHTENGENGFITGTKVRLLLWEVYDSAIFVPINPEDI